MHGAHKIHHQTIPHHLSELILAGKWDAALVEDQQDQIGSAEVYADSEITLRDTLQRRRFVVPDPSQHAFGKCQ
jgi:hypothetical protein